MTSKYLRAWTGTLSALIILILAAGIMAYILQRPITTSTMDATAPERLSLEGTFVCLPHKETNEPQTTECASGVRTDEGEYYGLNFSLLSSTEIYPALAGNERIRVEGPVFVDTNSTYQITGVMHVTSLQRL